MRWDKRAGKPLLTRRLCIGTAGHSTGWNADWCRGSLETICVQPCRACAWNTKQLTSWAADSALESPPNEALKAWANRPSSGEGSSSGARLRLIVTGLLPCRPVVQRDAWLQTNPTQTRQVHAPAPGRAVGVSLGSMVDLLVSSLSSEASGCTNKAFAGVMAASALPWSAWLEV